MAKNILAPLGTTAAAAAIDAKIQKILQGSETTTLIISNEEMNNTMKLVKLFKILISHWKELLKQLKMKQINKKEDF